MFDFILETNVINLGIVVAILYTYGKETVLESLAERRTRIVQSLTLAEKKYQDAKDKLDQAKASLEGAKQKTEEVKQGLDARIRLEKTRVAEQREFELILLQEKKTASIQIETDRMIRSILKVIRLQLVIRVFDRFALQWVSSRRDVKLYQHIALFCMIYFVDRPVGCISNQVCVERRFIRLAELVRFVGKDTQPSVEWTAQQRRAYMEWYITSYITKVRGPLHVLDVHVLGRNRVWSNLYEKMLSPEGEFPMQANTF
jgi:F-type H+-transporting ATPase subunit b